MEYRDKLLRSKVDSMKQSDRIEYNSIISYYQREKHWRIILGFFFTVSSIFCSVLGISFILLSPIMVLVSWNIWLGTLVLLIVTSFIFLFVGFDAFRIVKKIDKRIQEETEKFIENPRKN